MTSIERLDDETLLDLSRLTDELGVLSVYVNAEPTASPDAAAIDLKNRYRELLRQVGADQPTDGPLRWSGPWNDWDPEVEQLTRAGEPGRGRAAFAALGADWLLRIDSQLPLPNRLVADAGSDGRAAG